MMPVRTTIDLAFSLSCRRAIAGLPYFCQDAASTINPDILVSAGVDSIFSTSPQKNTLWCALRSSMNRPKLPISQKGRAGLGAAADKRAPVLHKPKAESKAASEPRLTPDIALLIEARVKAGERNVQMKDISNLLLHDPVLTVEIISYANSVMFGGSTIQDVETAVTRLGTKRLIGFLSELNTMAPTTPPDVCEAIEILRYNCRRYSIVTLILAGVLRPAMVIPARAAGLFADVGHMLAALQLGAKYCEAAKKNKRATLAYRLEKDHSFDLNKAQLRYLKGKGIPRALLMPYDLDEAPKVGLEKDLRLLVQAAKELIEAYDAGKLDNYAPGKALPANCTLRTLSTLPFQQQRIHHAVQEYLRIAASEEAPEGASLLISAGEEDENPALAGDTEQRIGADMVVPRYPNLSISPKSRDALRDFLELCEKVPDELTLSAKSVDALKKSGMFARVAILRVSPEGNRVAVENAIGLGVGPGADVEVPAGRSPFASERVDVRSTQVTGEGVSAPFGTSAFGLGPLGPLPSGERRVLYVDCAEAPTLKLETRRVFRLALGLLSQCLQAVSKKKDDQPDDAQPPA